MQERNDVDVAIFGGGVAGLWTLNYLSSRGYGVVLIEKDSLGNGQTIVSQGIIHGGIKYALSSDLREDSVKEVSGMPDRWRLHLSGRRNDPDLSAVNVSSPSCYLWVSRGRGLIKRAEAFMSKAGVRLLNTKPKKLQKGQAPEWLEKSAQVIYQVEEPVVDTRSLLEKLAVPYQDRIVYADAKNIKVDNSKNPPHVEEISLNNGKIIIHPQSVILTAGQGNRDLAYRMGVEEDVMQERPLRQLIVRGDIPEFYGHCIDGGRPDITITTHRYGQGNFSWNIGGKVAEDGPHLEPEVLIEQSKERVDKSLEGLDLSNTHWATFDAIRAEAKAEGGKPGGVEIYQHGNVFVAWPTKLALAPLLADRLEELIPEPSGKIPRDIQPSPLQLAIPPWE